MGNAENDLKKSADDMTDNEDIDGLFNSFKKYNLKKQNHYQIKKRLEIFQSLFDCRQHKFFDRAS